MDASIHFDYNPLVGGVMIRPEIKLHKIYEEEYNKVFNNKQVVKLGRPEPLYAKN